MGIESGSRYVPDEAKPYNEIEMPEVSKNPESTHVDGMTPDMHEQYHQAQTDPMDGYDDEPASNAAHDPMDAAEGNQSDQTSHEPMDGADGTSDQKEASTSPEADSQQSFG